jgi:hypothetical protein
MSRFAVLQTMLLFLVASLIGFSISSNAIEKYAPILFHQPSTLETPTNLVEVLTFRSGLPENVSLVVNMIQPFPVRFDCPLEGCSRIEMQLLYSCSEFRFISVSNVQASEGISTSFSIETTSYVDCRESDRQQGSLALTLTSNNPLDTTSRFSGNLELLVEPVSLGDARLFVTVQQTTDLNGNHLPDPPAEVIPVSVDAPSSEVGLNVIAIVTPPAPVNVRSGPGVNFPIISSVLPGQELLVLQQSLTTDGFLWLLIQRPDQRAGWISSEYVTIDGIVVRIVREGRLSGIPVVDVPPLTAPPVVVVAPPAGAGSPPVDAGGGPNTVIVVVEPTALSVNIDSDGDGIVDANDPCPNERGVNHPTCADNDADGVINASDPCPTQFGTSGGCPDGDQDGVPDTGDRCQGAAGPASNAGCPIGRILPGSDGYPRKAEVRLPLVALTG